TNTGTAPRSTNAFAVETNVKDGMMTSSPGSRSSSSAAISSAAVHECVSSARFAPVVRSSHAWQRFVNTPSPARCPCACASAMYASSRPVMYGRLNGIPSRLIRGFRETGAREVYTKPTRKRGDPLRACSGAHDDDQARDHEQRADDASRADRLAEHERAG